MVEIVDRLTCRVAEQRRESVERLRTPLLGRKRVECARVGEAQQDAGPGVAGADVEGDEHRPFVRERLTGATVGAPKRRLIGDVRLTQVALWPVLRELFVLGRQRRVE